MARKGSITTRGRASAAVKRTTILVVFFLFFISSPLFLTLSDAIDQSNFISALDTDKATHEKHWNWNTAKDGDLGTWEADMVKKIGQNMGITSDKLTVTRTIKTSYSTLNHLKSTDSSKRFQAIVFFEGENEALVGPAVRKAATEAETRVKSGANSCWIVLVLNGSKESIAKEAFKWLNNKVSTADVDGVDSSTNLSREIDFTSLYTIYNHFKETEPNYAKAWVEGRVSSTHTRKRKGKTRQHEKKVLYVIVRVSKKDPEYYYAMIKGKVTPDFYQHHIALDSPEAQTKSDNRVKAGHNAPNSVIVIDSAANGKALYDCVDKPPTNNKCSHDFKIEHFKKNGGSTNAPKLFLTGLKSTHPFEFGVSNSGGIKKVHHFQENCNLVTDTVKDEYCRKIHVVSDTNYKCQASGICNY